MHPSKLPNWEELRRLPLRAIVAYAVRYARRVQPLWQPCRADYDSQVETVERGLEAIESFCRAEKLPRADFAAADRAAREMAAEASDGVRLAAKAAAFALRSVGQAIEAGNQAAAAPDAGSAVVATAGNSSGIVPGSALCTTAHPNATRQNDMERVRNIQFSFRAQVK